MQPPQGCTRLSASSITPLGRPSRGPHAKVTRALDKKAVADFSMATWRERSVTARSSRHGSLLLSAPPPLPTCGP